MGTGPEFEQLPTITVEGYDLIPAVTDINLLITNLRSTVNLNTIKIGIEYEYKYRGGDKAYFYEPTAFNQILVPSALASTPSAANPTVTYTGSSIVLG